MVIKTKKGMYFIQRNYRDAFQVEAFEEKYIEECMDRYLYIVGDISSGILRLKGFDSDVKSKNYFGYMDDYLERSCALGCPYYILKRIPTEAEFEKLKNEKQEEVQNFEIHSIEKENFDKESLVLKSTPKNKPRINIDIKKINEIPKGKLSEDLQEFVKQDKSSNQNNKTVSAPKENVQTYVSASPDFDPSKSNSHFNRNNNNRNQNNKKPNQGNPKNTNNSNNNTSNNNNNPNKNRNNNNKNKNTNKNKQV